jgi:hypothetical protein
MSTRRYQSRVGGYAICRRNRRNRHAATDPSPRFSSDTPTKDKESQERLQMMLKVSAIQREPHLHCHLPMRNLVLVELAAHLGDFKPTHIADCFASSTYCVVNCVFDAVRRGTDQLDLFVDVVTHEHIKCFRLVSGEHIPRIVSLLSIQPSPRPYVLSCAADPKPPGYPTVGKRRKSMIFA